MAITGNVQIKVDTALMRAKAQAISKNIINMQRSFEQLETIINRTSHYWIGEAGNIHRRTYQSQKAKVGEIMKRLKEHPADLLTMAGAYDEAESKAQDLIAALPGDMID